MLLPRTGRIPPHQGCVADNGDSRWPVPLRDAQLRSRCRLGSGGRLGVTAAGQRDSTLDRRCGWLGSVKCEDDQLALLGGISDATTKAYGGRQTTLSTKAPTLRRARSSGAVGSATSMTNRPELPPCGQVPGVLPRPPCTDRRRHPSSPTLRMAPVSGRCARTAGRHATPSDPARTRLSVAVGYRPTHPIGLPIAMPRRVCLLRTSGRAEIAISLRPHTIRAAASQRPSASCDPVPSHARSARQRSAWSAEHRRSTLSVSHVQRTAGGPPVVGRPRSLSAWRSGWASGSRPWARGTGRRRIRCRRRRGQLQRAGAVVHQHAGPFVPVDPKARRPALVGRDHVHRMEVAEEGALQRCPHAIAVLQDGSGGPPVTAQPSSTDSISISQTAPGAPWTTVSQVPSRRCISMPPPVA